MARKYDRFMVHVDAASNRKMKRMKRAGKEVRWAWFHGVLPIAAQADIRGTFAIGFAPADAQDVADQADCTLAEARKALQVARELGMLVHDENIGCDWVHDWDEYQPEPKKDRTNATRQARYRERHNAGSNGVTNAPVTPPEVEEEVGRGRTDVGTTSHAPVLAVVEPIGSGDEKAWGVAP